MGAGNSSDFERPQHGDDLYQHPHHPQLPVIDPRDGMPRVVSRVSMEDSKAPPLAPETMVCMGDESVFVIRDIWGEVQVRVDGAKARRWFIDDGMEQWVAPLSTLEHKQAGSPVAVLGTDVMWYAVEPLRPQCQHYRRVMTDFENTGAKQVERVCTAQRSDAGEFLSLRDQRVHACEHRSPRDFVSEARLREFDAVAIAASKESETEWDGEAALSAVAPSPGETHNG